jgi:inner membrane protein
MDLITQGLLGSTVAQAACGNKLGRKSAFYGFLIGLLPDLDIVSSLWGPWASLKFHRGPTHSFIILALLSLPAGYICRRSARSGESLRCWIFLAFVSLMTHPVIDWFTSYGTCLFWPLTDRRYALDCLPIIDLVFSLPLLAITLAGISGRFNQIRLQKAAVASLTAVVLYSAFGLAGSQSLIDEGNRIFRSQGFEPIETRATPTLLNTMVFRVFARDNSNNYMITYLRRGSSEPLTPIVSVESAADDLVATVLNSHEGRLFKWFAMNMIQTESITGPDGNRIVTLNDMRYGLLLDPGRSLFSAQAVVDPQGKVLSISRRQNHGSVNITAELAATLRHAYRCLPSMTDPAYGSEQ